MAAPEVVFRLDGRVAMVTGGGQGIGEVICRRLAAAGARVAVFDLQGTAAERVARDIGGMSVAGDVTSETDVAHAASAIARELAPIDILVNNAGITGRAANL